MTEKEKAAICLMCDKLLCLGEAKCFAEKKKEYIRQRNAEHRQGEQALNYICNVEYSQAKRDAMKKAIKKHRKDKA